MGALIIPALQLRFRINVKKSKKKLEQRYHAYNTGRPRAERLKSGDMQLGFYLIEIAAADIRDRQAYETIQPFQHLPFFRTSNPLLAKKMGVTSRTVINRRDRLSAAGFLAGYRWRTSHQKYDLRLATAVLHIDHHRCDDDLADHFYPRIDAPLGSPAYEENFSALCNQLLKHVPKEKIQLEQGVALPPVDVDNDFLFACLPAELQPKTGDTPNAKPALPAGQEQETEVPPGDTPPKPKYNRHGILTTAPIHWWQVTERLTLAEEKRLRGIVAKLWAKSSHWNWFGSGMVAQSQQKLAQIRLAEWFTFSHPRIWQALEAQFAKRMDLVAKYVLWREQSEPYDPKKRQKAGRKALWFPPPAQYFDIRSTAKMSFRNTRPWYRKQLAFRAETDAKSQLTKAKNQIRLAGYADDPYAVETTYGKCLKRLEKYGDQLLHHFIDYTINLYGSIDDLQP